MHAPTKSFFDITTNTASYVVRDPSGTSCAIIDSVLDFDYASGQTDTKAADQIIAWVKSEGLDVKWILETHAHADHARAPREERDEVKSVERRVGYEVDDGVPVGK